MIKKMIKLLLIVAAVGAVGWTAMNQQYIRDRYIVATTDVQPQAQQIGDKLDLTSHGEFLYRASQPLIQQSEDFNTSCGKVGKEHTIVLGCYTAQRIYVYDVVDQRLDGVKEVTAAHELLHAAYDRLPDSRRQELDLLLEKTANAIEDQHFKSTIEEYRSTDKDMVSSELYSVLGTEIEVLPEALELHFSQYFKNRNLIVSYSKQYQKQFKENEDKISQYDVQLKELKSSIDSLEQQLTELAAQVDSRRLELAALRESNVEAYNNAVPGFNSLIIQYNTKVNNVQSMVSRHNNIVNDRNAIVGLQTDLNKQLDSTFKRQ